MSKCKILYVASEITPFLQTTEAAKLLRELSEAMQERGMEARVLVPRFGLINERRNRLHEVIRLSGVHIAVGAEEKPLIIKVASTQQAKLQVYFIDNEDYFRRKSVFFDKQENFHEDNDERAIFFCKGVMETMKKLGWAPDIVHCNGWMTSLIPLYLNTAYKNDPIFKNAKTVFTIYDNPFEHKFDSSIIEKAMMVDINEEMLDNLKSTDFAGFIKMGVQYADAVTKAKEDTSEVLDRLLADVSKDKKVDTIERDENFLDSYYSLYNDLAG